ncbi:MAG TPA: hypothetical protein VMR98_01630, partial [Candidatus Polarisedimenticolaceae bacterium]|nr:hypothetical protein [Candidatus Polarisedimenticolaceae bacterium]
MKCQHCGSKDIIAIQGQNFCLSCGVEVAAQAVPVAKKAAKVAPAAPTTDSTYKPTAKPQITQVSVTDHPKAKKSLPQAAPVHPLQFALKVATSLAVLVGILIGSAIWFQLDNDLLLYLGLSSVVLLFIFMTLAQAALLYGFAKKFDGHPTTHKLWWAAGRAAFMDIMNINLMSLIVLAVVVGTDLAIWQYVIAQDWHSYLEAAALSFLNAGALWLLLGAYVAKRLAVPAVVVGGMSAAEALKIGWRFY